MSLNSKLDKTEGTVRGLDKNKMWKKSINKVGYVEKIH